MKLLLVVNPISGGKSKELFIRNAEAYCKKYGIHYEYFHTTGKDDINKLKIAVEKAAPDRVASIGGDGTTLMTSLALRNSKASFGIIPMGSANGMAKELSVPNDPMLAFQDLVTSQIIVPLDLIKVNDAYTIHLGDVGVNATMVEKFAKEDSRGWASYARHFVEAMQKSHPFHVSVEINGSLYQHNAFAVIIANTRMYGTGAIINPRGNPHDGLFEIVIVKQNDLKGIINLGLTAISDKALESLEGYYEIYQGTQAQIKFEGPKLLQLDGEVIGKKEKIDVSILPATVKYISTNDNLFVQNR